MTRQSIDTSSTGDTLKQGFDKSEANFTELYNGLAEPILWEEIEGKPEEYPPAEHEHNYAPLSHSEAQSQRAAVTRSNAMSIPNATPTAIPMQSEIVDTGSFFDAARPDRFTILETGFYLVTLNAAFVALSASATRCLYRLNYVSASGSQIALLKAEGDGAAGGSPGIPIAIALSVGTGEEIIFEAYQNSGTSQTLVQTTNASILRFA